MKETDHKASHDLTLSCIGCAIDPRSVCLIRHVIPLQRQGHMCLQGRFWQEQFQELNVPDASKAKFNFEDGNPRVGFRNQCARYGCSRTSGMDEDC